MREKTISSRFLVLSSLVLLYLLMVANAFGDKGKTEKLVFNLDEISAFEVDEKLLHEFVRGQVDDCDVQPKADVRVYPAFKSDKPLYGSIRFASEYGEEDTGIQYHFAVDESQGARRGYDLLYFDLNRDLDLTNDTPLVPMKNPPDGALLTYSSIKQHVCIFDYLNVNFDFGSAGQRPLEIMPRLTISESGYTSLSFATTKAHKGEIEIAGQQYTAFLGHNFRIDGWFDRPWTALHLIPEGDYRQRSRWWGAGQLRAIRKIEGTYYRFYATPAGDKLFVRPYDGEFGTFKIGSGWRLIFNKQVKGSLLSKDAVVAVGGELELGWPKEARSCSLPVGDYFPAMLTLTLGPLRISVSDNYHSDGKPRDRAGLPPVYGIKIRKDKPFVLDFSNKPDVIFASPAPDLRLKPGEKLDVKAVLVDPELDIMIRGLEAKPSYADSTLLVKLSILVLIIPGILWLLLPRLRRRYRFLPILSALGAVVLVACLIALPAIGPKLSYDEIIPRVLITRANGEKVAEGAMPFG